MNNCLLKSPSNNGIESGRLSIARNRVWLVLVLGEFKNDLRHGQGSYIYPSSDKYTGSWVNGKKHGKGTYVYADLGSSISGDWSNGVCMNGTWTMHDKSKYIGRFSVNQPNGTGLVVFPKNVQSGTFVVS